MPTAAKIVSPGRLGAGVVQRSAAAPLEDRRPQALAAMALMRSIEAGARMTAQRRALRRWTGGPAVAQLELPAEVPGTINKEITLKGDFKPINPAVLQHEVLTMLEETGDCRIGSYYLDPGEGLARKPDGDTFGDENHGMDPLPDTADVSELDARIIPYIRAVLGDAGQMAYIETNANEIYKTHRVIVDVDCQFNRTGGIGFHKDSRGSTVFVNLTFHNDKPMTGTDHYEDLVGDEGLEGSLPDVVRGDINTRRAASKDVVEGEGHEAKDKARMRDIRSPKLPAYGRMSFSDPNNYHSTPLMGHREPTGEESLEMMRRVVAIMKKDASWLKADEGPVREAYKEAGDEYNSHGLEDEASTPQTTMLDLGEAASKKTRRLSRRLEKKKVTQKDLNTEAEGLRTFIRTWVRFVPKALK